MKPPTLFLSYNRKDIKELRIIAQTLMIHGIKTWQDVNNLGTGISEEQIRDAIQKHCSGLLFFCTNDSIKSPMILLVELPEAEQKYKRKSSFHIVPIFKIPIKAANNALKGSISIPLSNFNGVKIEGKTQANRILNAAHRASEIILNGINFSKTKPLLLGLVSKQRMDSNTELNLDFTPYFIRKPPSQKIWNKEFITALVRVKNSLIRNKIKHLRLCAFAHLSLGVLFGYIFRDKTSFILEIEQPIGKGKRTIWKTNIKTGRSPLKASSFSGDLTSKNLCVKINLITKDDNCFCRYVKKSGLSYRAILELSPINYPCIISNSQAVAIAKQLAQEIKKMHALYGTSAVHIFSSIPLGLALLIGYNLNACGKIQCYDFDNGSREYYPSCTLGSNF